MELHLQVIAGQAAGQAFTLNVESNSRAGIGRSPDNAISFPNERSVSSHHAEIIHERGRLIIVDRGSTNGIYANNQRVRTWPLSPGAIVRLGQRGPVLQFHFRGQEAPQQAPGYSQPQAGYMGGPPQPPPGYNPPGAAYGGYPQQQQQPAGWGCAACGAPLGADAFQCAECQRPQCAIHYDAQAGCCVSCASAKQVAGSLDDDPFGPPTLV